MHRYFYSPRAAPFPGSSLSPREAPGRFQHCETRASSRGQPTRSRALSFHRRSRWRCPSWPSPRNALGHRYKWHRDEGCGGQGGVNHLPTAQAGAQHCGVKRGCCRKALLGAELAAMVRSCLTASPCEAQTPTSLQGESLRDLQLHFLTSLMR